MCFEMSARVVSLFLLSVAVLDGQDSASSGGLSPAEPVTRPSGSERAISRSEMFRVAGGDSERRGSVALFLEKVRDDFEDLLRDRDASEEGRVAEKGGFAEVAPRPDDFVVPVDVVLLGKEADEPVPQAIGFDLRFTEDSFLLRLRVHLGGGIDELALERAALTVLLYERSLRGLKPGAFDDPLLVRPWLVEGLLEAARWRAGRADRGIYEGVFRRGGGFTLDELFELPEHRFRQLDGASRLAFRALSGALVIALLEQPGGRGGFRAFCDDAARFSGEMPVLLRRHFPDLNLSEQSLAKWWALTLAKLVEPKLSEVLSIRETEEALVAGLTFHGRDASGKPVKRGIEEWRSLVELDPADRVEDLRVAGEALTRLSYRCFPSYRPMLAEYQRILRELGAGGNPELDSRLAELAEQRRVRVERALRARDYMDYFEISRARDLSGEFDDYLRLKQELELRPRTVRKDRISLRLDTMQRLYEAPRKPGP